jgi:hypothetical protein
MFVGQREDLAYFGRVHQEVVRARVQLDAARPELDAPRSLGHGAVVRVEAAKRDEPAVGAGGLGEDQVIGVPVAAGLVHREDDPPGVERGQDADQLLAGQPRAIRVVCADVGVSVEEGNARQVREKWLEPRLQQRFVDRVGQGGQSNLRP